MTLAELNELLAEYPEDVTVRIEVDAEGYEPRMFFDIIEVDFDAVHNTLYLLVE